MSRLILWPGVVTSSNDGQQHYISARRLAKLYRVNYQDCVVVESSRDLIDYGSGLTGDITLAPRSDGNYSINSKDLI